MEHSCAPCLIEPGDIFDKQSRPVTSIKEIFGNNPAAQRSRRRIFTVPRTSDFLRKRQGDRVRDASLALSDTSMRKRPCVRSSSSKNVSSLRSFLDDLPEPSRANAKQDDKGSSIMGVHVRPVSTPVDEKFPVSPVIDLTEGKDPTTKREQSNPCQLTGRAGTAFGDFSLAKDRAGYAPLQTSDAMSRHDNVSQRPCLARTRMKVRRPLRELQPSSDNGKSRQKPGVLGAVTKNRFAKRLPSLSTKQALVFCNDSIQEFCATNPTTKHDGHSENIPGSRSHDLRASNTVPPSTPANDQLMLNFRVLPRQRPHSHAEDLANVTNCSQTAAENIRLKELTGDEFEKFRAATYQSSDTEVVAQVSSVNISLTGADMRRLRGRRWLNDEVINAFCGLINARSRAHFAPEESLTTSMDSMDGRSSALIAKGRAPEHIEPCTRAPNMPESFQINGRPRAYVFNSFFYTRLVSNGYDYSGVRRWPLRAGIDVRKLDMVLIPVNLMNFHWVLAAIDLKNRSFLYMDSMNRGDSSGVLTTVKKWLYDEIADKHGSGVAEEMNIGCWSSSDRPPHVPRQGDNGSCGVFVMYLADYMELGKRPDFTQEDNSILRKRAVLFLTEGRLPDA